jgi:hypothetical protein
VSLLFQESAALPSEICSRAFLFLLLACDSLSRLPNGHVNFEVDVPF